jgi:S1-C subfamily serine protease
MRSLVNSVLAAQIVLLATQLAGAQTAFEQLEKQVRSAVGQPVAGQPSASQPPAGQEPGYLGLIADDRQSSGKGIRVMEIVSRGPAEQAGLKTGDLITSVNNQAVHSMDDFARAMSAAPVGAKLSFEIQREGATQAIDVVLGQRPPPDQRRFQQFGQIPETVSAPPAEARPGLPVEVRPGLLGVRIAAVTPEMQQTLRLPSLAGALIVAVVQGTPAAKAGIQPGATVVAVDGKPVERPGDLTRAVVEAGPGRQIKLSFYQQGALVERQVTLDSQTVVVESPATIPPPAEPARPPILVPPANSDDRVQQLQQRIEELERKVRDLEQALKKNAPPAAKSGT